MNTTNTQDTPTSEQSTKSKTYGKRLSKETSSKVKIEEVEQNIWEEIEGTPFHLVGPKGGTLSITLGKQVVSPQGFKTIKEAKEYIDQKPWELILIATMTYGLMVEEANKNAKKQVQTRQ